MARSSDFSGKALARSSRFGAVQQVLHLATRFVLTPFVVVGVGLDAYAYWSLLFALLGWIGLHRTGFVSAAVPLATTSLAEGAARASNETLRAAANLVCLPAMLCFALAWWGGETLTVWLGVTEALRGEAHLALIVAVGATALALMGSGYQGALEARNAFPRTKSIEMGAATFESGLIVLSLVLDGGLLGLALAYAARLGTQTLGCFLTARHLDLGARVLPGPVPMSAVRRVWRFGVAMQGIGFVHLTIGSLDRLLFVHFLGLEVAGLLELARKLVGFGAGIVAQGIAPLAPAVAHRATVDPAGATALVSRGSRLTAFFGLLPLTLLAAAPETILLAWLGEVPPHAGYVLRLVAAGAFVHLLTGPWTAALRGLAEPRLETTYSVTWLVLLVIGVPLGNALAGLQGAVAGAVLAQTLGSSLLIVLASRRFAIEARDSLRETLRALLVGAGAALAVALILPEAVANAGRLAALPHVVLAGTSVLVLIGLVAGRFVLTSEDRGAVRDGLRRPHDPKLTLSTPELDS